MKNGQTCSGHAGSMTWLMTWTALTSDLLHCPQDSGEEVENIKNASHPFTLPCCVLLAGQLKKKRFTKMSLDGLQPWYFVYHLRAPNRFAPPPADSSNPPIRGSCDQSLKEGLDHSSFQGLWKSSGLQWKVRGQELKRRNYKPNTKHANKVDKHFKFPLSYTCRKNIHFED